MKFQLALCGLLAMSFASCDSNTSTTTATSTDTAVTTPAADPNMVTTTTTTTTTRPAFVPKTNVQYMDLRTKKMITVRVDTVHHYIVNTQTNQPVDWIMEPGTTDTFYGRNMQMANGYINYGNGSDWSYDESRASSSSSTSTDMNTTPDANASDAGVDKVKSNSNETKVKMDDGSKMKSNSNETKIKNK